jgi:hypothetical protein
MKKKTDFSEELRGLDELFLEYKDICRKIGIEPDATAEKIIKAKKDTLLFVLGKATHL